MTYKWDECYKRMKEAIAETGCSYSQSKCVSVTIDGKGYSVRQDCSGYVDAALEMFGAFPHNYRTNSTGFSHDKDVEKKLNAAGFTKKAFPGWDKLVAGTIISDDYAHVEIFAYNKSGKHYVYSNGSTKSVQNPGVGTDSGTKHTYDTAWFPPTSESKKDDDTKEKTTVTYAVHKVVNGWTNDVVGYNTTDNKGYAGSVGTPIDAYTVKLSTGTITYCAHRKGGDWGKEIKGFSKEDTSKYAGSIGKEIDAITIKASDINGKLKYRVYKHGKGWGNWITGYSKTDTSKYAGSFGTSIDAIQIGIE